MHDMSEVKRRGLTLVEVLVVLAIIACLVALTMPAIRQVREPARRTRCKNNLKQIGLALHNYLDMYGAFPPPFTVDADGNRLHSWRTLILPFIDQAPLDIQIDFTKPWDDPANAEMYDTVVSTYMCPSSNSPQSHTIYIALVGEDRAFHSEKVRELVDFKDSSSNTAMVAEVSLDQALHWMSPFDDQVSVFTNLDDASQIAHMGLIHVLFADGSVRTISCDTPEEKFRQMSTIDGGDELIEFE